MAGRSSREWIAVALAAILLSALTCGVLLAGGGARAAAGTGGLELKRVGGFSSPVFVEDAPGAPKLLFVVEQRGTVRVVRQGKTLGRPFLNITDQVRFDGEEGLLSIAFDPGYERNRRFYVYYVTNGGDIRVDSVKRKRKSATRAAAGSRRKLIEIPHPRHSNHNGGQLQFGPDGLLYIGTGDGGSAGDPEGNAQNPNTLLGKILRIDPGKRGYSTPASNPLGGNRGRGEIYALGLRNPFRFSFDSRTGDILIGDVGQDEREEINRASEEGLRGANFGWDLFEGNAEFEGNANDPPPNYVAPIHDYDSNGGNCAVTGGYVVRDPSLGGLEGRYVYADFCAGDIRSLDPRAQNPSATDAPTGLRLDSLSSFGEGARGKLYAVSLDGQVARIARR